MKKKITKKDIATRMIKNWYKINQDIWDLDLQKAKKPYHQVEDAILNTIILKKKPTKFFSQADVFITLKACNLIFERMRKVSVLYLHFLGINSTF